MRILRLGLLVPLLAASPAAVGRGAHLVPVSGFLCDSAVHAIQFADARAAGDGEEIAKDRVGRTAKAEVCGRYVGLAAIETEQVKLDAGTAYKLTAFRFKTDHRVAWLAERSFAPTATNWDL